MGELLQSVLDWLYPRRAVCICCEDASGLEQDWLCPACREALAQSWVGAAMEKGFAGAAFAYRYMPVGGAVVKCLKYRGATALTEFMAEAMVRTCGFLEPMHADMIAYVPMHRLRKRRRGFNQSECLAREMGKRMNLPVEEVLFRRRSTVQQARLTGEERRRNLKNSIEAAPSVRGKNILLVDDVFTTGATARECARALRAAGAENVYVAAYTLGKE